MLKMPREDMGEPEMGIQFHPDWIVLHHWIVSDEASKDVQASAGKPENVNIWLRDPQVRNNSDTSEHYVRLAISAKRTHLIV
jgi:hypothetical protein